MLAADRQWLMSYQAPFPLPEVSLSTWEVKNYGFDTFLQFVKQHIPSFLFKRNLSKDSCLSSADSSERSLSVLACFAMNPCLPESSSSVPALLLLYTCCSGQ